MARIVCISKYPPIEGGISAKTHWLAKALRERGHKLSVIADREDASEEYRVPGGEPSPRENTHVCRPTGEIPWHIPNDRHRAIDLLNVALEVIGEQGADVIDTGYLIPYGIVGYLASLATGVPFVVRHGGSDLAKFFQNGVWSALLHKTISSASLVITDRANLDLLLGLNPRSIVLPPYIPDPDVFNPRSRDILERPVLLLIGKANYYWRDKGWDRAIDLMQALGTGYRYRIISQGVGLENFKGYVQERLGERVEWNPFVHPNRMPDILRSVSAVFCLEGKLPFPAFSNIAAEALYCGSAVITDNPQLPDCLHQNGVDTSGLPGRIITLTTDEPVAACREIGSELTASAKDRYVVSDREAYEGYVTENERVLLSAIRAR